MASGIVEACTTRSTAAPGSLTIDWTGTRPTRPGLPTITGAAVADYAAVWHGCSAMGSAIMADRPLVRCFWRVLDRLDYWLTQARLWLADTVCGSLPDGDGEQPSIPGKERRRVRGKLATPLPTRARPDRIRRQAQFDPTRRRSTKCQPRGRATPRFLTPPRGAIHGPLWSRLVLEPRLAFHVSRSGVARGAG
jgi:hypothetical protein